MLSDSDEEVKDYWKIGHGTYIVKMVDDVGLEDEVKNLITMPLQLGVFVLLNSKRNMNKFNLVIGGFYTKGV